MSDPERVPVPLSAEEVETIIGWYYSTESEFGPLEPEDEALADRLRPFAPPVPDMVVLVQGINEPPVPNESGFTVGDRVKSRLYGGSVTGRVMGATTDEVVVLWSGPALALKVRCPAGELELVSDPAL